MTISQQIHNRGVTVIYAIFQGGIARNKILFRTRLFYPQLRSIDRRYTRDRREIFGNSTVNFNGQEVLPEKFADFHFTLHQGTLVVAKSITAT